MKEGVMERRDARLQEESGGESLRSFLRVEGERLRIRHRLGLGGIEVTGRRSALVDQIIRHAGQIASPDGHPFGCAVVAVGGYGRNELAPFSDVDLLFLRGSRRADDLQPYFDRLLYLLWDAGLVIGHSLRSVSECVDMARKDLHTRTALMTARLLSGEPSLFEKLGHELERKVYKDKGENRRFLDTLNQEMDSRYEKFGRAVCMQEPNVKESAGGLRDLHAVEWVGADLLGASSLDAMRAKDFLSDAEYGIARRAYDFLARVRNEAHFTTGRKTDLLLLDLQPQLAANLGYQPRRGLLDSELLMRDYYQRASELHRFCRSFLARVQGFGRKARFSLARAKPVSEGFEVREGIVYLSDNQYLRHNPAGLLEAVDVARAESATWSEDLRLAVEKNLTLINREFRSSATASLLFIDLLGQRGRAGRALRLMHETGLLGRILPEFARITFLVQHDYYHRYTIDEHTLRAVEALDGLASVEDMKPAKLKTVFAEVDDVFPLYLGMLLHDIGKGHGKGHVARGVSLAERVCQRLQLDGETEEEVLFLVEHHLLMSHLAERRDLSEDGLIEGFTAKVGSLRRLNMLLLLTYADSSAVAPGVWNDWKAALLWDLYSRARQRLSPASSLAERDPVAYRKQEVLTNLPAGILPSQMERHFAMLPERYARVFNAGQVIRHLELVRRLGDEAIVVDWRHLGESHCTELVVCAPDHKGLFAQITGTLTACGIDILSTDMFTREDRVALDTFKLVQIGTHHPIRAEHWARVERKLKAAIEGSYDGSYDVAVAVSDWLARAPRRRLSQRRPRQPSVRFDSTSSPVSTIIEVMADDEPGLAYRMAATLAALDINISFARITTEKNRALDIFYLDSDGKKLSEGKMEQVERALIANLTPQREKEEA